MNLLDECWMPVRLHDGGREWVAPHQLSDSRIAAFDADRADFNGALAQFAIGLLQTCTPAGSAIEWRSLFNNPPDSATLEEWFQACKIAFEFDGDGARFMQDFDLRAVDAKPLDSLTGLNLH
jgi:CRISPR system Cascade subunit CasA